MGWLTNVVLEEREIENESLELTDKNSLYFLSTNLVLRNCTVVTKVSARNILIKDARFIDCAFEIKQELKNHQQWVSASLRGCRFKGKLSGCDFGYWPEYSSLSANGFIEDCDFSEARMDGCRIMGCDPRTIRFPKWPCFTILEPLTRLDELSRIPWPGKFGHSMMKMFRADPPVTRAVTFFAPNQARFLETTPEELKAVIEPFDFILS